MSYTTHFLNPRQDIQIEMVDSEGNAIMQKPISIEELMREGPTGMDIGHGYSIQLDQLAKEAEQEIYREYAEQGVDDDDDEEEEEEESESETSLARRGESLTYDSYPAAYPAPPPGAEGLTDWYAVLHTLQQEGSGAGAGAAAARIVGPQNAAASRREIWSALSPPSDPKRNYKHVEYVSVIRHVTTRQFRPPPLSLHAATAYLHPKDKCQRVLVYGGVGAGGKNIEQEMYEFSLLSCGWKRLEGKNFVPAGHYGHTLTTIAPLHRVVVVGGIGPGGVKSDKDVLLGDPLHAARAAALLHFAYLDQEKVLRAPSLLRCKSHVGFVPYVFDMDLDRLEWRAIQIPQPLTLAFHTAVAYGKVLYLFGGLTETGAVSNQLLAMEIDTFAIRVVGGRSRPLAIQEDLSQRSGAVSNSPQSLSGPASPLASGLKPPLVVPLPTPPGMRTPHSAAADQSAAASEPNANATLLAAEPQPQPQPDEVPEGRFLHTAVRYGHYMILHGGFNAQNEPLGDTWAFDMIHERWERLKTNGNGPARAGHCATVVGSRMLVTGGFGSSLEECLQSKPESAVAELSLIPTPAEEYRWRTLRSRPPLPGLAFSTASACGDHLSLLLVGGVLPKPKPPKKKKHPLGDGSTFLSTEATSVVSTAVVSRSVSAMSPSTAGAGEDDHDQYSDGRKAFTTQFVTLDDAIVMSFPLKQAKKDSSMSGGEVDLSVPEQFKPFVRRQEDFLKKKYFNVDDAIRKITMSEKESMEPTLYLKTEEIELLIGRGEEMCSAFTAYDTKQLPSNVPDRERRVHILENTISLGRQTRDILKSMKGSEAGITAVKSKTHRQRGGQKFEDYSAAKPFRRFVVTTYIQEIQDQLKQMKILNKGLREVSWEEKDEFIESIAEMQQSVDRLLKTIHHIMKQYVHSNVEKLMKGVEKHKDVMKKLTDIVQKNEHDKIWGVQQARDSHRAQRQGGDSGEGQPKRFAVKKAGEIAAVPPPVPRRSRSRSAVGGVAGGAAYYSDESEETALLNDTEWYRVLEYVEKSELSAEQLAAYCREGMHPPTLPQGHPHQEIEAAASTSVAAADVLPAATSMTIYAAPPTPSKVPPNGNILAALLPVTGADGQSMHTAGATAISILSNSTTSTTTDTNGKTNHPVQEGVVVPPPVDAIPPPPNAGATSGMNGNLAALLFDAPASSSPMPASTEESMPWLTDGNGPVSASAAQPPTTVLAPPPPPPPPLPITPAGQPAAPSTDSSSVTTIAPANEVSPVVVLGTETSVPAPPVPAATEPPAPEAPAQTTALGGATTRDIVVRHSNHLREETERVALMVRSELRTFSKFLRGSPLSSLSSSTTSAAGRGAAGEAAAPALDTTDSTTPTPTAMTSSAPVPPPVAPPPGTIASAGAVVADGAGALSPPQQDPVPGEVSTITSDGYHTLPMAQLHALVKAKERFLKTAKKTALIRCNEWDANDLAGAPQDVKVEKLCRRLEKHLTALTQSITASFLSAKGAKRRASIGAPERRKASVSRRPLTRASSRPATGEGDYPTVDAEDFLLRRRRRQQPRRILPPGGQERRPNAAANATTTAAGRSGSNESYSSDFNSAAVSPENSPRPAEATTTAGAVLHNVHALPRLAAARSHAPEPLPRLPAEVMAPPSGEGETAAAGSGGGGGGTEADGGSTGRTVPLVPFQPLHTLDAAAAAAAAAGVVAAAPPSSVNGTGGGAARSSSVPVQLSSAHAQGSVLVVDGPRIAQVTPLYQSAVHTIAPEPTSSWAAASLGQLGSQHHHHYYYHPQGGSAGAAAGGAYPHASPGTAFAPVYPMSMPMMPTTMASAAGEGGDGGGAAREYHPHRIPLSEASGVVVEGPPAFRPSPIAAAAAAPRVQEETPSAVPSYSAAPITSCSPGQFATAGSALWQPGAGMPANQPQNHPGAEGAVGIMGWAPQTTTTNSGHAGSSSASTPAAAGASTVDEDYFYFGQPAQPALSHAPPGGGAPVPGHDHHRRQQQQQQQAATSFTRLAPQHVSAPVGTTVYSPAALSAGERPRSSRRSPSASGRQRHPVAHHATVKSRSGSARAAPGRSGPMGSSTISASSSLPSPGGSSAAPAALHATMRTTTSTGLSHTTSGGVLKSKMTPGERRIMEARERLRRK